LAEIRIEIASSALPGWDVQESHKHLDEYAELEAEIMRDIEQEQAHKNCGRRPAVSLSVAARWRAHLFITSLTHYEIEYHQRIRFYYSS